MDILSFSEKGRKSEAYFHETVTQKVGSVPKNPDGEPRFQPVYEAYPAKASTPV